MSAPRRRPPPRRRVPAALALIAVVLALVAGLVVGYAVRGDPDPAALQTVEREIPVVTVTEPSAPIAP